MKILTIAFQKIDLVRTVGSNLNPTWESHGSNEQEYKAVITIEKKMIYVGRGGNYTFKAKEITAVDDTRLSEGIVTFQASKHNGSTVTCIGPLSSDKIVRQFCKRLTTYRQQNNDENNGAFSDEEGFSKTKFGQNRHSRGLGGEGRGKRNAPHHRGSSMSKKARRLLSASKRWDDEGDNIRNGMFSSATPRHSPGASKVTDESRSLDTEQVVQEQESSTPSSSPFNDKDDHDINHDENEATDDDDDSVIGAVRNTPFGASKKQTAAKKRRVVEDDDSDDEQIPMTTPSASTQRMVSPSFTNPKNRAKNADEEPIKMKAFDDTKPEERVEEETQLISDGGRDKGQPDISRFFSAKGTKRSSEPSKENSEDGKGTPAAQTPPRKVFSTNTKRSKISNIKTNDDWLSDTTAVAMSPKRQQEHRLMGSSAWQSYRSTPKPAEEEDPIEDDDDDDSRVSPLVPRTHPMDTVKNIPSMPRLQGRTSVLRRRTFGTGLRRRNEFSPTATRLSFDRERQLDLPSKAVERSNLVHKPQRRHRGLKNLGNTCYMNASIQMIANWVEERLSSEDDPSYYDQQPLLHSFASISHQLLAEIPKTPPVLGGFSIDPTIVKEAIDQKTNNFSGYEQRDAHEFLSEALDYIHEELEKRHNAQDPSSLEKASLPTDDFKLIADVKLTCSKCAFTRTKEEMYRHLSIDLPQSDGAVAKIPFSLDQFFQPEDREVRCEKCGHTHARQTMKITKRPKMLLLHLKRFVFMEKPVSPRASSSEDENSQPNSPSQKTAPIMEYVFQKNESRVDILPDLSLERYCQESWSKSEEATEGEPVTVQNEYELCSIVHHVGSRASSGHYTAQALRIRLNDPPQKTNDTENPTDDPSSPAAKKEDADKNDHNELDHLEWAKFDDANSGWPTTLEKIRNSKHNSKTPYMLLYQLKQE